MVSLRLLLAPPRVADMLNTAHGQIKEVSALRHNLIELEREHQKLKEQYGLFQPALPLS
jgi:hypothetical protein